MTRQKKTQRKQTNKRSHGIRVASVAMSLCIWASALMLVPSAASISDIDGAADVSVTLNGEDIMKGRSAIINSRTYIPFREFCELYGAKVGWDNSTKTATAIKTNGSEIKVKSGGNSITIDGKTSSFDTKIINFEGRLYIPIRPIADAFGAEIEWIEANRTVKITDDKMDIKPETKPETDPETSPETTPLQTPSTPSYSEKDLYWLSRIIQAEAGGESYKGQLAVGSVVLNRVKSKSFPNTVYGVIFDRKGGVQFSPVSSGTIYNTPSSSAVKAAKQCLEGYRVSEDVLFFLNPKIATSSWIQKNRTYAFTIGNHDFYI